MKVKPLTDEDAKSLVSHMKSYIVPKEKPMRSIGYAFKKKGPQSERYAAIARRFEKMRKDKKDEENQNLVNKRKNNFRS